MSHILLNNIDLWTSAVRHKSTAGRGSNRKLELAGINKLRELILELAVRGKLVPQNPDDEPASELLKRIEAEKAQLVKDGKLKKQKPLPPVTDEEKPFELPQGWEWVRLGNLAECQAGFAFKSSQFNDTGDGLPLIRIRDVGHDFSGTFYSGEYRPEFLVEKGDYLISMDGIFRVAKSNLDFGLLNQRVSRLNFFSNQAKKDLIVIALQGELSKLQGVKAYTTVDHLSGKQIQDACIPLPPANEQHRIVTKVDELMALCDQLEQQSEHQLDAHQQLTETLLATLTDAASAQELSDNWQRLAQHFDLLFSGPMGAWAIDRLKDTILQLSFEGALSSAPRHQTTLKNCLSFGPKNGLSPKPVEHETKLQVLKLGATSTGTFNLEETKYVPEIDNIDEHLPLKENDILLQRGNTAIYVGSNVLIHQNYPHIIYPDLMMKIRVKPEFSPKFISLALSSPKSRQHMWSKMTGTSGTMPKISKKVVESVPISVYSLEEQNRIVAKVDELFALCDQLKERLQHASDTQLSLTDAIVEQALN